MFTPPSWSAASDASTAVADLLPFWRRHLQAQRRLYRWQENQGELGRSYRSAVVWTLTTFMSALQDCSAPTALRHRAKDTGWWDALCRAQLDSPSLMELRVQDVPLSGHALAETALALRYLELTQRYTIDPTVVLDDMPPALASWLGATESSGATV